MPKKLVDILSVDSLRRHAGNPDPTSGLGLLAKMIIEALDAGGPDQAETVFLDRMPAYFYNMSASAKRRYADALTKAFCDEGAQRFDELWEYLKSKGVTGRTYHKTARR